MDEATLTAAEDPEPALCCRLVHPLFTSLGEPVFRRSATDGEPVMAVALGAREATLPLVALMREFGIRDDSEDGRMLARIVEALDFVSALRLGDPLPSEVLTGEASWSPDPAHYEIAAARLRVQLVDWLASGSGGVRRELDGEALMRAAEIPAHRQQVQAALAGTAAMLGLASAADVLPLLEVLGRELAYIEALRERLLRRVRAMVAKVELLSRDLRNNAGRLDTISQVRRLSAIALRQITARFDALDAKTGDVIPALRHTDSQTTLIRANRDWLYRTQRAWEPLLLEWDSAGTAFDRHTMSLLGLTYHFLAPRFMPVTEWISATRPGRTTAATSAVRMIW